MRKGTAGAVLERRTSDQRDAMTFAGPFTFSASRFLSVPAWASRPLAVAGLLGGLLLYVAAFRATWVDDAYIQLRYARTLLEHGTWGFYADHPANTATSPLNVLLLAAAGFPLGSVERAVTLLTALELAALLWLLLGLSRRLFDRDFFGWFAFVALAANPLLLSTIGMESILYALLLVAAVAAFLGERWLAMAVALGLLTLTRPDGVLLLVLLLPLAAAPLRRKGAALLVYAATIAPWFVFSWVSLGSFVPDTLVIKLGDAAWGATSFADGLALYLRRFPLETLGSLFLVPFCVFPIWRCGQDAIRFATVLIAYAGFHYAAYSALDVPPYHWYFVHQLVPLLLVAAIGVTYHVARFERGAVGALTRAAVLVPAAGLLLLAWDEGFPFAEAPINTNWATSRQYRDIADWMRDNLEGTAAVAVRGEIGTVAFYADHYMVNEFSDMSLADALIDEATAGALPGIDRLMALNFYWRRDHAPLPTPTYEFVPVPVEGLPRCLPGDAACRMVRDGTTEWTGTMRLSVRRIG